eukprot:scaffold120715_cov58-Attheya_sp.AAC.2
MPSDAGLRWEILEPNKWRRTVIQTKVGKIKVYHKIANKNLRVAEDHFTSLKCMPEHNRKKSLDHFERSQCKCLRYLDEQQTKYD